MFPDRRSPIKRTPLPTTTPNHRTVFGSLSPNRLLLSTNAAFYDGKKIISPNFNVVNSDWSEGRKFSVGSRAISGTVVKRKASESLFGARGKIMIDKEGKKSDSKNNHNHNNNKKLHGEPTKSLRRTNTAELLDRFIPSRTTSSGKLTFHNKHDDSTDQQDPSSSSSSSSSLSASTTSSMQTPTDHIENQTSRIYKNIVAEACGLEVGERILQFQPAPPESKKGQFSKLKSQYRQRTMISASAAQARIKRIPKAPEKVLDAPQMVDDFYLNLLSWSKTNYLAIALENSVYSWNANTGETHEIALCDSLISSVRWSDDGSYLSVGTHDGTVEIWDFETKTKLRNMRGHDSRIAAHSWNKHTLTSGSRTGQLFNHDVRISQHIVSQLNNHTAEVCGVEWRPDGMQLATGGNDNLLNIWDARSTIPQFTKTAHNAAVKALAWCPQQTSLLASGGGSSCMKIHFWNTTSGARLNTIETESQVSSLKWGYANGIGLEIAATHGYPNNDISIHSYPSLQKTGMIVNAHESRILHSAISPDNTMIATVAGDENLKFWKLFDVNGDQFDESERREGIAGGKDKLMTIR